MVRKECRWIVAVAAALACGAEEPPAAGTQGAQPGQQQRSTRSAQAAPQADTAQDEAGTGLLRETFSYRGAGRDPFVSLLRSGDVRPLVEDLRVTTINFNIQYPGNSVAVLRDQSQRKRYTVRVGDRVGRLRIVQIREKEVVVTYDEFGVERQEVLRLLERRQED